ncbi:MAG: hypothetical protein JKX81_14200 [Arenicella sp.]|nr:hypothetical protein [Arenicella sp.]
MVIPLIEKIDKNGAFVLEKFIIRQILEIPAAEVFAIDCNWSDAELGTIPCAYRTPENMLHRANIGAGDHVLVAGASVGVGSAVVQLAKRRGAIVTAIVGKDKIEAASILGVDRIIARWTLCLLWSYCWASG